jgi:SPP1 family predicted phage head-tail adaptor
MSRSGSLDRSIEIQEAVETLDASGGTVTTWTRVANEWAEIMSVDAPEAFLADRTLGSKTRWFKVRHLEWLTSKHRFVFASQNYDILSISGDEGNGRNHFLKVLGILKE